MIFSAQKIKHQQCLSSPCFGSPQKCFKNFKKISILLNYLINKNSACNGKTVIEKFAGKSTKLIW